MRPHLFERIDVGTDRASKVMSDRTLGRFLPRANLTLFAAAISTNL
ncbi:MAG: hypothetical protein AAF716_19860 [Cyanobacteria bacterium P01_D01_bin.1]